MAYNRGKYPYFTCWKYAKGVHPDGGHVQSSRCEEALISSLQSLIDHGCSTATYYLEAEEDSSTEATSYESQLKKIAYREKRAKEAYLDGIDSSEEYRENKKLLQAERESLQKHLEQLNNKQAAPGKQVNVDIQKVVQILKDDSVTSLDKHMALEKVLEKMVYDRESGEFKFYYLFDRP